MQIWWRQFTKDHNVHLWPQKKIILENTKGSHRRSHQMLGCVWLMTMWKAYSSYHIIKLGKIIEVVWAARIQHNNLYQHDAVPHLTISLRGNSWIVTFPESEFAQQELFGGWRGARPDSNRFLGLRSYAKPSIRLHLCLKAMNNKCGEKWVEKKNEYL